MELGEVLNKIPPTTIVHIGTENGNGWIAVDTAENVAKHVQEINDYLYLVAKARQRVYEGRIEEAHDEMSKLAEEIRTGNLSMEIEVASARTRKCKEIIGKQQMLCVNWIFQTGSRSRSAKLSPSIERRLIMTAYAFW